MHKTPTLLAFPVLTVLLLAGLLFAAPALAQVPIVFEAPPDHAPGEVWLTFLGDAAINATYNDTNGQQQTIANWDTVSLADITSPTPVAASVPAGKPAVMVNSFQAGRIYINYGTAGLSGFSTTYEQPSSTDPSDTNYGIRWQYIEPTVSGTLISVDLSYIECVAIPMSMTAVNVASPADAKSPQLTTATGSVFAQAAAKASSPPGSNVLPSSSDLMPSANFARVEGPYFMGAVYQDWSEYLNALYQNNVTAILEDCFVGSGPTQPSGNPLTQQQYYTYTVEFQESQVLLTPISGSGDASGPNVCLGDGNEAPGGGVGDSASDTITILYSDMSAPSGIYGNNGAYTYHYNGEDHPETQIQNDFFGRVVGDVYAGMSWGFFGSTTPFTYNETTNPLGQWHSMYWWAGKNKTEAIAVTDSAAGQNLVYEKAQPTCSQCYDPYAAVVAKYTSGYGSPLQDRLQQNLMVFDTSVDTNSYLLVTINPDSYPSTAKDLLLLDSDNGR